MKGLKRLALVTAVSALSSNVMAEVQMLDEDSLQDVTGQAGLTLDVRPRSGTAPATAPASATAQNLR